MKISKEEQISMLKKYSSTSGVLLRYSDCIRNFLDGINSVVGYQSSVVEIDFDDNDMNLKGYGYDEFANDLSSSSCPYGLFIIYRNASPEIECKDIVCIGITEKQNLSPIASNNCNAFIFKDINLKQYIPLPLAIMIREAIRFNCDPSDYVKKFSVLCLLFDGNRDAKAILRLKKYMKVNATFSADNLFDKNQLIQFEYHTSGICSPNLYQVQVRTIFGKHYLKITKQG